MLLVALLMASCASTVPQPQRLLPPVDLLQDCFEPPFAATTNGLLADTALKLRDALRSCNRDKAALREWAQ